MQAWPEVFVPPLSSEVSAPTLHLFDSYNQVLRPVSRDEPFTMYVCGITPYDATHIGHAATYLTFDLIHRYLKVSKVDVHFLENVTDIDDPLFERARRDEVEWRDLGRDQLRLFISDMTNLRVIPPMELSTVTEAMPEIIQFVQQLAERGLTYRIGSDTYLDAGRITDFSDLPMKMAEALEIFAQRGGDPERSGKRHPLDPLLWRASNEDEPEWQSEAGSGRPGWHIECNAISSSLLKGSERKSISLQGGGMDLRFPHHYMTALQGKARFGFNFADLYVHAGMIRYQGEKMSKSLGNLVFVSDLVKQGVNPMAIRAALISGHYRDERDWSESLLQEGKSLIDGLLRVLSKELVPPYIELMNSVMLALSNDLNTPLVFELLSDYVVRVDANPDAEGSEMVRPGALARFLDAVLGITL